MPTSPNIRSACGGSSQRFYIGGCDQHNARQNNILVYTNETQVANYAGAGTIDPYARLSEDDLPNCADVPTCTAGNPACGPWETGDAGNCISGFGSWNDSFGNCYASGTGVVDLSSCTPAVGFKNLQVKRVWHGAFDFCSHDSSPLGCADLEQPACCISFEGEQTQATQVKYLTRYMYVKHSAKGVSVGGGPVTYTFEETCSVGANNGVQTVNNSETGPTYFQPYWDEWFDTSAGCGKATPPPSLAYVFASGYTPISGSSPYQREYVEQSFDCTGYRFYYKYEFDEGGGSIAYNEYEAIVRLSDENHANDIYQDAVYLLSFWPFDNDIIYPWRTDGYCTIAPLLTRNEVSSPVQPTNPHASGYVDPAAAIYDGSILGLPLTYWYGTERAQFEGFFNFEHRTWKRCEDIYSPGNYPWYIYSYGAKAGSNIAEDPTDAAMPTAATQWTENYAGSFYPPYGPFQTFSAGVLTIQIWAQTLYPYTSLNYARPCGKDRFEPDWDRSYCATNWDTLSYYVLELPEMASGDLALVCGAGGDDGIWRVNVVDYNIYLETLVIDPSQIPSEYLDDCDSCGGGPRISKLRWQNSIPPICGRIYPVTKNLDVDNNVIVSFDTDHYLVDNDSIWVYDANGSHQTATINYISATQAKLSGISNPNSVEYLRHYLSQDWKWDDRAPKYDYVVKTWSYNYRDQGENERLIAQYPFCPCVDAPDPLRQGIESTYGVLADIYSIGCTTDCIRPNACAPAVVWWGFASYNFPNSDHFSMPSIILDERYGARWQANVMNWMQDPYWQAPDVYCDAGYPSIDTWEEDDGSGAGQYPMRPYVEARCSVPEGAPHLPNPLTIGCATVDEMLNGDVAGKGICIPVEEIGSTRETGETSQCAFPWILYLAMKACVCNPDCQWNAVYANYGVVCDEEEVAAP